MAWEDINDGDSGAEVRAKINAAFRQLYGGMVPVSSVTVMTPVEYVDIALPAGYTCFKLVLINIVRLFPSESNIGQLTCGFSKSGVWVSDQENLDSYQIAWLGPVAHDTVVIDNFNDAIGYLDPGSGTNALYMNAEITLYPGVAGIFASLHALINSPAQTNANRSGFVALNLTKPGDEGRVDAIRLMPEYGNGDLDPPTGGGTFTAGTITLFGISS